MVWYVSCFLMARGAGHVEKQTEASCLNLVLAAPGHGLVGIPGRPASLGGSPTSAGYKALPGKSPVVVLSGEFFQAMEKLANSGAVYGDRQELFLEQIATAQRFVVKTNLTLIDQNEKIIRLLEELNRRGQGEKR